MEKKNLKLHLKIWRQSKSNVKGQMVDYELDGVEKDMSFLEMLDYLNEKFRVPASRDLRNPRNPWILYLFYNLRVLSGYCCFLYKSSKKSISLVFILLNKTRKKALP